MQVDLGPETKIKWRTLFSCFVKLFLVVLVLSDCKKVTCTIESLGKAASKISSNSLHHFEKRHISHTWGILILDTHTRTFYLRRSVNKRVYV